jgi:hypothetical protein
VLILPVYTDAALLLFLFATVQQYLFPNLAFTADQGETGATPDVIPQGGPSQQQISRTAYTTTPRPSVATTNTSLHYILYILSTEQKILCFSLLGLS